MYKKIQNFMSNLLFLTRYSINNMRSGVIILIIYTLITPTFSTILLILPKYIIDSLTYHDLWNKTLSYIFLYIGVAVFVSFLKSVLQMLKAKIISQSELRHNTFFNEIRTTMEYCLLENSELSDKEKLLRLELSPYNFLSNAIFSTIESFLNCILSATIIGTIHVGIVMMILLFLFVHIIVTNHINKINYNFKISTVNNSRKIEYLNNIFYNFDHVKEVRINGMFKWLKKNIPMKKSTMRI